MDDAAGPTTGTKRKRLSHACKACRARKVRCDERLPACTNCSKANIECVTDDPRRPHLGSVKRTRASSTGIAPAEKRVDPPLDCSVYPTTTALPQMAAHSQQSYAQAVRGSHATEHPTHQANKPSSASVRDSRRSAPLAHAQQHNASARSRPSISPQHSRSFRTTSPDARPSQVTSRPHGERSQGNPIVQYEAEPEHDDDEHDELDPPTASSPWADPTWMRNALGSASASIISDSQAQDRFKYVGSSNLQVFSHWIDLLLARQRASIDSSRHHAPDSAISEHFDHGRIHSEEFHFTLRPALPGLTELRHFDAILDDYFRDANSVFPVFDEEVLRRDTVRFIQQYRLDDPSAMRLDALTPYEIPLLATIYLVTALGLLDVVPRQQAQVKLYLDAAYSLYGNIIGVPYLSSVQALLLLHLVLKATSRDGASWQALGSAIRVAYSIGLHRAPPSPPLHSAALERTKARIWWCCYALDRIVTLDSGRPTMINDLDVQLSPPRPPRNVASTSNGHSDDPSKDGGMPDHIYNERYLANLVSLCRLKAEIHNALYTSRNQSVEEAELFSTIAALDQKLMTWSSSCVNSLHLPTLSNEEALRAASKSRDLQTLHLLCTYHFTVINVHRASVMLDTRLYRHHVASKLNRRKDRLLSAETICRGSARAIIRCINQYRLLHQCSARMIMGTIALSAVYVLAICIFKHPKEWNVASDLALIDSIAKTVSQDYRNDGMPAGFTSIFGTLQRLAVQCVRHNVSRPPSPPPRASFDAPHAEVSLEPFWRSLGFGQVVPSNSDGSQPSGGDNQEPIDIPSVSASASALDATTPLPAADTTSFQSLLDLDQPNELLYSLLGLPDFFTPTTEEMVAELDPLDRATASLLH